MLGLRKPQKAMIVKATKPNSAEPAARPSRPSVRFTAWAVAKMIAVHHSTTADAGQLEPGSRRG